LLPEPLAAWITCRRGLEVKIRTLERQEVRDLWSIDRAEVVDKIYYHEDHGLALKPDHHDIRGWPPGEREHYGPILLDCFDRGGTFYGAFDGETRTLFETAVARARELGARQLYVSATPSENTVRFYLRLGCRVTDDVDATLFNLEPEDIHLVFDIPV
jgi:hypothetical protein